MDFDDPRLAEVYFVWTWGRRKAQHADVESKGRVRGNLYVDNLSPV